MEIQWYPGHMAKTKRMIQEMLPQVDAVCEIVDARIPYSSHNPDLEEILSRKPKIIVLNRDDLADPKQSSEWVNYYLSKGYYSVRANALTGDGFLEFRKTVQKILSDKIKTYQSRGQVNRNIRLMVVGIPNVGKSSFINRLANRKSAKVENRPGVTRTKQWVPAGNQLEILDTPGVLWPKFDNMTGLHLAFTGAIKDDVTDIEDIAFQLTDLLSKHYLKELIQRYKIDPSLDYSQMKGWEILECIALKRGCIISRGEADLERMSKIFLDEFRSGKIGRITLERPAVDEE